MQTDGKHGAEVKCKVFCEFRERSIFLWNYHSTFIKGTDNVKSSTVIDHAAKSAMHTRAMDLYCIKTQALSPLEYATITISFAHDTLQASSKLLFTGTANYIAKYI